MDDASETPDEEIEGDIEDEAPGDAESVASERPESPFTEAGKEDETTIFCNQCGWENPPGQTIAASVVRSYRR